MGQPPARHFVPGWWLLCFFYLGYRWTMSVNGRIVRMCYCAKLEWLNTSEPYYKSCECQFRDDVKVVNLAGAGFMLVAK